MSHKLRNSSGSADLKIPRTIKKSDSRAKLGLSGSSSSLRTSGQTRLRRSGAGVVTQSPFDRRRIVIEKWNSGVVPISATMSHNLSILDSSDVTINVLSKVNHILIDNCSDVVLRLEGGVISQVEIVHCKNVSVIAKSNVPVIQIDMTDGCRLYFRSPVLRETRIIHASSPDLQVFEVVREDGEDVRIKHDVPFSMFGDHQVIFYDSDEERLSSLDMSLFKKESYFVIP